ncbi:MAG: radical SAM protein [Firmicutes bacterium]|nr:radical SAM protein [Bacillota bacterium]MBP3901754.1 radical SAM protein [Blautia sp.]
MHFTGTVYRNPYWPTWPLLEITQGCTHNKCKFCTMYKEVPFRMSPIEWIEEDLKEIAECDPGARTIQLLSANPLVLTYDKLAPIFEMIHKYLPKMEYIYLAGRVSDLKNKTVDELKKLKDLGMREISLGVESGDDRTLDRIHKGYHAEDILEEAQRGEFDPLSEKEMLEELKLFVENLKCDCSFITHHTISGVNLSGPDFLSRKERIVAALERQISHGDLDRMEALRRNKRTL